MSGLRVVFAGPSLYGAFDRVRAAFPDLQLRPPAACGDVARAVADGAAVIGLVDGAFGDVPSVWHKEILHALESGAAVGGGASMGALRAVECAAFGMVGLGTIYRDYRDGVLVDDEAVGLIHGPAETGYMPLSVPRVNFQATVEAAARAGRISRQEGSLILVAAHQLHFAERSFAAAVGLCQSLPEARRAEIVDLLEAHVVDRKCEDAWAVLRWAAEAGSAKGERAWRLAPTGPWRELARRTGIEVA